MLRSLPRLRTAAIFMMLVLSGSGQLQAQDLSRSLRWAEIDVRAHLDADGRLHVREHQAIVFDGDWNGGEREFRTRLGQRLTFDGISRLNPATGEPVRLRADEDLEAVDRYHREGDRVRWRSRLPEDPPFGDERIDYVLDYTLANAVIPRDEPNGAYLLDHDFLFADRDGVVERFTLTLTLDPGWSTTAAIPERWEATDVRPGRGFEVRLPLRHAGTVPPASVPMASPSALRVVLLLVILGGPAWLVLRFFLRERDAGRYAPLPTVPSAAWLEEHVFPYPPEVVGAAWDGSTSAPEVAGMLARLVQEGKMASRVEPGKGDGPVLHLFLKTDRGAFDATERPLIDALFFDGREEIDTVTLREHYESSGFDPAGKIAPALEKRLAMLPGPGPVPRRVGPSIAAVALSILLLVAAALARPTDALVAVLGGLLVVALGGIATGIAGTYSARVVGLRGLGIGFLIPLALLLGAFTAVTAGALETTTPGSSLSPYYRPGPLLLTALAGLGLSAVGLALAMARPVDTPARLAFRRRLAAARAYFAAELARPRPRLRDEWFPYILALGLGPHVDRWFEAHGPAQVAGVGVAPPRTAAGSADGSSGGGWTGGGPAFGGGGGFVGAGVGGSWGTAAGTIATGVAAPSSGSGGGGASSGGGGGGGW